MNDTERDLRELFDSKAREAGGPSPATSEVLRRGRRRQVGTVAVAGLTALAIAAAAVVSLQSLTRADTDAVPGGPQGNPGFTATIQNFTLIVPQGWTLIDQVPLGMNMAVGTSSSFSCVGTAIEAGSGQHAVTTTTQQDCPTKEGQISEPPTIPRGGLPMLTLSNEDPGLGGVACNAGGSPSAASATLYVGLDYGALSRPGVQWESDYPVERGPLTNVLQGDLPTDQMPCGPGGYSRFQAGGQPFIAWAGFGSQVTDADRQLIVDIFNGMQVSDGAITPPSSEVPGYVVSAGTVAGIPWRLEAGPFGSEASPVAVISTQDGTEHRSGGEILPVPDPRSLSLGAATFGADGRVVFGVVGSSASGVEFRVEGGATLEAPALTLPPTLGAEYSAFALPTSASLTGTFVAVGPDGDLGAPQPATGGTEPTAEDRQVQADLRNAYVAAKTFSVDANTYEGFDPRTALTIEPSLAFNTAAEAVAGEVSIRDVGADHIVLAEPTTTGSVFCIAETNGLTTYGAVDAQTSPECVGGDSAWGQDVKPTTTPTVAPPATSTVDLEGIPVPTTLSVSRDPGASCLTLELNTDTTSVGTCAPFNDRVDSFAVALRVGLGNGSLAVVGFAPPDADHVFMVEEDGTRTDAPFLHALAAAPDQLFFAFPVGSTSGTVHIEDVHGQVASPIPV